MKNFDLEKLLQIGEKIFLNKQESCVINGGITAKYSKLEKGAGQGESLSAYFFILFLEILFMLIKNKNI